MGLRGKLKKLERAAEVGTGLLILPDGTEVRYEQDEAMEEMGKEMRGES